MTFRRPATAVAANAMNRDPLGPVAKEKIRLAPHLAAAFALTKPASTH